MKTNSIHRSPLRRGFLLIPLLLVCFGLSPTARAVLPPPVPDGGYPNFNTAEGTGALQSLTTGHGNTATGFEALLSNTTGGSNTANGSEALRNNTTGINNTANGVGALLSNTTINGVSGNNNTATGFEALESNKTGSRNTAVGAQALVTNATGTDNTATGWQALSHYTGNSDTAVGSQALANGSNAPRSTAVGFQADMNANNSGNDAFGYQALLRVTSGQANVGIGAFVLGNLKTGSSNTAVGNSAGFNMVGSQGVFIGQAAGLDVITASNVICIGAGNPGANVANSCYIANIRGVTTANPGAVPVLIDDTGQLGTASSSRRFKKDIKPMDKTSEAILAFKPVTFHYKSDATKTPQFGLVAEEVAKVNPDLIVRDADGQIYSVRYDAVNAMLLNEFLKEHRKVQQLEKQVEALSAGLQKVSAQLEVSKPAPQTVLNQ